MNDKKGEAITGLTYLLSLYDGCGSLEAVAKICDCQAFLSKKFFFVVIVITQAAGAGSGKNIDIYGFGLDIYKDDLEIFLDKSLKTIRGRELTILSLQGQDQDNRFLEKFVNDVILILETLETG